MTRDPNEPGFIFADRPGPVYDCGDPDCDECNRAFGPDRSAAIAGFYERCRIFGCGEPEASP